MSSPIASFIKFPVSGSAPGPTQPLPGDTPSVPVFSRMSGVKEGSRRVESDKAVGGSAAHPQGAAYQAVIGLGRSALEVWDGRRLGGYGVPSPDLSAFPNARQVIHPVWVVNKNAGDLRISSVAHPPEEPCVTVSSTHKGVRITLNGQELSPHTSYVDLQLAKTLLDCLDKGGRRGLQLNP